MLWQGTNWKELGKELGVSMYLSQDLPASLENLHSIPTPNWCLLCGDFIVQIHTRFIQSKIIDLDSEQF